MLESAVEKRLKARLEGLGFKVLKLSCPGTAGAMDRMILRPKHAPGPPVFVEVKRPGQRPRPLQLATAMDWKDRGADVRRYVSTFDDVDALLATLLAEAGAIRAMPERWPI